MSTANGISVFVLIVAALVAVVFVFLSATPAEPPRGSLPETKMEKMEKFLGLVSIVGLVTIAEATLPLRGNNPYQFHPTMFRIGAVIFACSIWPFLILLWKGTKKGKSEKSDKDEDNDDNDEPMLQ